MRADVGTFLERSLSAIGQESPASFRALRDAIGALTVGFDVDGETARLERERDELRITLASGVEDVALRCTRAAVVELVEARLSLLEAALIDRVEIVGRSELLARFYDAWMRYLAGAVRSPSFPALLDEFLGEPVMVHSTVRSRTT